MENLGFIRFDFVTSEEMEGKSMLQEASSAGLAVCLGLLINTAITRPYGEYTKEGYLFFEENTPVAYDGPPGYIRQ